MTQPISTPDNDEDIEETKPQETEPNDQDNDKN